VRRFFAGHLREVVGRLERAAHPRDRWHCQARAGGRLLLIAWAPVVQDHLHWSSIVVRPDEAIAVRVCAGRTLRRLS
jgi:hypothetical protein